VQRRSAAALAILASAAPAEPRPAVIWEAEVEVASGGGRRGPWRMNQSDYDYVDDGTVAIDGASGDLVVAWVDQRRKDVFLRRYRPGGEAGPAVDVSRTPEVFSWLPRVAVAGDEVHVLWQEIVFSGGSHGGDLFHARSGDGGRSFAPPTNLSRSREGDGKGRLDRERWDNGSLDLAVDGTRVLAAWTAYEGTLWVAASDDGGRRFSAPVRVADGDGGRAARGPALVLAPEGAAVLAWSSGDGRAADIHVAPSRDGGKSFGAPEVLAGGGARRDAPDLVLDGAGTLHLLFAEGGALRHARRRAGERRFSTPALVPGTAGAGFPAAGLAGDRALVVVWEILPAAGRPVGLGHTVWRAGGYAPSGLVPGTAPRRPGWNGSQQGLLGRKLATAASGAVAVVHSSFSPGRGSRVTLLRGRLP
jgi:hypothetical protein